MRKLLDRFYKAIAVILLFTGTVFAQNYMWPTNASEYLSSSFCEYRDGHYHSAIDVKTWNTEGYPCYAVADGYIKRIRISPFGYGKVLYLQLTDGRTAVYAHLQKFPREIEKQIISSQYENKQYRLDWWPKNLKVKKGDIIAYTGRTGIGVPHLHFEIRNRKDNPINPLKFYSQVKDGIRPKLIELAVIPISENATVNGTFLPARYPLHYIKDGLYVITEPVYASGKIGLAIHGYDQADDVYNKYGFNQSTLEVAGDSVFQITYDELDFSWTGHIDTELYYPLLKTERKRFNKLYLEPFNPMTFYNRSFKKDGTIQMSETPVPFTVTVSDFMNNRSIIRGEILPAGAYSIRIVHASRENDWLYVKFSAPQIRDLQFFVSQDGRSWTPGTYFEIMEGQISNPASGLLVRIRAETDGIHHLKIRVNEKTEKVVSFGTDNQAPKMEEIYHHLGYRTVVEIPGVTSAADINFTGISRPDDFLVNDENAIQFLLPGRLTENQPFSFSVSSDSGVWQSRQNYYQALVPGKISHTIWFDSLLTVTGAPRSVMDTTLISVEMTSADTLRERFPIASNLFHIYPNNFPIFRSLTVSIQADSLPAWGHWSIYKTNGDDRISFLSTTIDSSTRRFTARTSSLGRFVLAADTVAPEVTIKSPDSGAVYKKMPKILVLLEDSISGIGDEENISLSLDGEYLLPEWDPEDNQVVGIPQQKVPDGNHVLTVTIRDRAGNLTRKAVYFKVE